MSTAYDELHRHIGVFLTPWDVRFLEGIIGLLPDGPLTVVDLGIGVGTTAFAVLANREDARVLSIDLSEERVKQMAERVSRAECQGRWIGVVGDSAQRPEGFVGPIDLLMIDSAHTEAQTQAEVELWLPLVRPGGYAWLHDWKDTTDTAPGNDFPGIRKVVTALCLNGKLTPVGEGEYGWAGRKV